MSISRSFKALVLISILIIAIILALVSVLDRGGQSSPRLSQIRRKPVPGGSSAASMPHTIWESLGLLWPLTESNDYFSISNKVF